MFLVFKVSNFAYHVWFLRKLLQYTLLQNEGVWAVITKHHTPDGYATETHFSAGLEAGKSSIKALASFVPGDSYLPGCHLT